MRNLEENYDHKILLHLCNDSHIGQRIDKTIFNLKLECVDADDIFMSPNTGASYKCHKAEKFSCKYSWYNVKCPKLCGKCEGTYNI